jgi:hypothetical protein
MSAATEPTRGQGGGPDIDWSTVGAAVPDEDKINRVVDEKADHERRRLIDWHTRDLEARRVAQQRARDADQVINGRHARLRPASSFRLRRVRWGWDRRMPVGELSLVPGREGTGKSLMLAWMAARITRGELPGEWYGSPRSVLYAATEDSWEHTIAPRMLVAGADLDLVYRVDVTTDEGSAVKLSLPTDVNLVVEASAEVDAVALMCDPIISFISDRLNTFVASELRGALEPLKAATERAGIITVGLIHFNKSKDTDVMSMVAGARAWTEVARAVVAVARDADADEYTCVVSQVKNSLGRLDLPHLTYTIDSVELDAEDGKAEVGQLRWTGETDQGVEDLLAAKAVRERAGDSLRNVVDWVLARYGETGTPVTSGEIIEAFGSKLTAANVRKILERAVRRTKELRRPVYGAYAPTESESVASGQPKGRSKRAEPEPMPCMTPLCENLAESGGPVCSDCAADLDRQDRATRATQDPLWLDRG